MSTYTTDDALRDLEELAGDLGSPNAERTREHITAQAERMEALERVAEAAYDIWMTDGFTWHEDFSGDRREQYRIGLLTAALAALNPEEEAK